MNADRPSPKLSVVTASFNALEGLRATVESVAGQGFSEIEHIVVDGGSDDGTREYLESLGDKVRWISEPDRGIADALNKATELARGDYVLVLQAEDRFASPDSLEQASRFLDGTDIVSFDVAVERDGKVERFASRGLGEKLEWFMAVPHQGAFVRRDLLERLGGYDLELKVGMDYEMMLRAKRAGASCRVVGEVLSLMPATGISARRDWSSLRARLDENRKIQTRHVQSDTRLIAQALFWKPYLLYKRLRHLRARA